MPPRRVLIVVNPIAGGGRAPRDAEDVRRRLAAEGLSVELVLTKVSGDAERAAYGAARDGADTVLACGGDGTINEVAQGIAGTDAALAVLPLGTANVLAHELGLGYGPKSAAKLVLHGCRRRFDLGRMGGRAFVCMASAGFDAYVTEHMAKWRRGSINYLSYVAPTLNAFWNYPYTPLTVKVDGVAVRRAAYHVIVGNVRNYGGPFTMTPRAKPDDGMLDVVAFGAPGHGMLALYMAAAIVHVHPLFHTVEMARGRRIEVEADEPVPVQLDGDFRGYSPACFEIAPERLWVLKDGRQPCPR